MSRLSPIVNVTIYPAQRAALDELARREGTTRSDIVRRALDAHLGAAPAVEQRRQQNPKQTVVEPADREESLRKRRREEREKSVRKTVQPR